MLPILIWFALFIGTCIVQALFGKTGLMMIAISVGQGFLLNMLFKFMIMNSGPNAAFGAGPILIVFGITWVISALIGIAILQKSTS